jgi:putative aldouronate transport system permease protein
MKNYKLLSRGEQAFKIFALIFLTVISVIAVLPFILIFMASVTDETTLTQNGYSFLPKAYSLNAYKYLINQVNVIGHSYLVSICITAFGTVANMLLTTMFAYPLSRKDFKYRNVLAFILFFTMLFNGGIVPSYLVWTRIFHIKNTYLALLCPNLMMGAFNVLLVRNYYTTNVPAAIVESAQLDGASEMQIFRKIMLPISVPVNVTVGLFAGLAYWNDWTNALYYVDQPKYYGIQNMLMRIMQNITFLSSGQASKVVDTSAITVPSVGIRMALAVVGIIPILIVYPFLQKNLIKGVVVGAIKG